MASKADADRAKAEQREAKRRKTEFREQVAARKARKQTGVSNKDRLRNDFLEKGIAPELPDFGSAYMRFMYLRRQLPPGTPLDEFDFKVNSQHGEDGILLEIFTRLGRRGGSGVEIAAGHNGGNSPGLVGCLDFRALWVEADPVYSKILAKSFENYPVTVSDGFVTIENVLPLLQREGFADDLDYLGVDIDGNDFWIWRALAPVRPRVVVAEYNPAFGATEAVTIAYRPDFDRKRRGEDGDWAESKGYFGVSIAALDRFARSQGYRLVCTSKTGNNAFFLRDDILPEIPAVNVRAAYRQPTKPNIRNILVHQEEIGFRNWMNQLRSPIVTIAEDGTPSSVPELA